MHCQYTHWQRLPRRPRLGLTEDVLKQRLFSAPMVAPMVAGVLTLAGCAPSQDLPTATTTPPPPATSAATDPTASPTGAPMSESNGTPITLTIGDQTVTGTLHDNPAANALARQLPLTLTFEDYNAVEKIAPLDSPPSMDGMPSGADPEIGDIGLWAPGGDLVLYYGDVGYWNGIARLGTFDAVAEVEALSGPFTASITTP